MNYYLRIKEIRLGTLQEKVANAIIWNVASLMRGQTSAYAQCSLIYVNADGGTVEVGEYFTVEIPNDALTDITRTTIKDKLNATYSTNKLQIKKIVEEIDTGKYNIYITKNMITYKKEFISIMQLFDYYYNRGYILEI